MPNPTLRRTTVYTLTVPRPTGADIDDYCDTVSRQIIDATPVGTKITSMTRSRQTDTVTVAWRSATDDDAARATADAVTADPAAVLHTGFGIHRRVL
jgi:hypothetical protein